jgi:hypothetical protein
MSLKIKSKLSKISDDDEILDPSRNADTFFVNRVEDRVTILIPISLIKELRDFMIIQEKQENEYENEEIIRLKAKKLKNVLNFYLETGETTKCNIQDESDDNSKEEIPVANCSSDNSENYKELDDDVPNLKRQRLMDDASYIPALDDTNFAVPEKREKVKYGYNTSRKFAKENPFTVTDFIIKPVKAIENTCMFYSMFNALRSQDLRTAFSGGSLATNSDPAYNFKNKIWLRDPSFKARTETLGFNEWDMMHYLDYLKASGVVKNYLFTRSKGWKPSKLFRMNLEHKREVMFLLCGISPDREYREEAEQAIICAMNKESIEYNKLIAGLRVYERFSKDCNSKLGRHGISLAMECDTFDVYMYETALKKRRQCTVPDLCYLMRIDYVYEFSISLA